MKTLKLKYKIVRITDNYHANVYGKRKTLTEHYDMADAKKQLRSNALEDGIVLRKSEKSYFKDIFVYLIEKI